MLDETFDRATHELRGIGRPSRVYDGLRPAERRELDRHAVERLCARADDDLERDRLVLEREEDDRFSGRPDRVSRAGRERRRGRVLLDLLAVVDRPHRLRACSARDREQRNPHRRSDHAASRRERSGHSLLYHCFLAALASWRLAFRRLGCVDEPTFDARAGHRATLSTIVPFSSRLLARLVPLLVPLTGCGGSTTSDTGTTGNPGAGGNGMQGAGGGSSAGGSGAQAGSAGSGGVVCTESTPLVMGVDTGYFLCVGSAIHRTTPTACPNKLPMTGGPCSTAGGPGNCVDSGCTASPHGYCGTNSGGGALICMCHYGCVTDAECGSGQICLCDASIGTCVTASCTKDADCQGGSVCLSYVVAGGCSATTQFACTTPQDACRSNEDCKGDGGFPNICGHDGTKRVCMQGPAACAGRPLVVSNEARLAEVRRGASSRGWSAVRAPDA